MSERYIIGFLLGAGQGAVYCIGVWFWVNRRSFGREAAREDLTAAINHILEDEAPR